MRFGWAALGVLAASAAACADATSRQAPRTVTVATVAREGEPRTDVGPNLLVWVRDKQNASWTYQVLSDGSAPTRLEGIHVGTKRGEWTWVAKSFPVETEPCDLSVGVRHPAQGGALTRASFVSSDDREQVVLEPQEHCDEHCPNEVRDSVRPVGSLGPYVFVEASRYTYACGAHGSTNASFLVWDLERGKPMDVLSGVPNPAALRAEAGRRFAESERELGGPFDEEPPTLTELLPVLDRASVAFEAQLTIATCYACSDGLWSSYTRSVRIRTAPPAPLVPYATLPSPVTTFLSRHPELTFGGWSEAEHGAGARP